MPQNILALRAELASLHDESYAWAVMLARGKREIARDALSLAYEKVLSAAVVHREQSSFRTFFFGVIRYSVLEEQRRAARLFAWLRRSPTDEENGVANAAQDPVETKIVWQALMNLPDAQREVLHLVFYAGLTIDEAATAMNIQRGSASQHYARGKSALAKALREKGFP